MAEVLGVHRPGTLLGRVGPKKGHKGKQML